MVVARDSLKDILGGNIQEVMHGNSQRWALEKNGTFCRLSKIALEKILQTGIETKTVKEGDILLHKGSPCPTIYICTEAEIELMINPPFKVQKGQIFGDAYAYPNSKKPVPLSGDLIVRKGGTIGEIRIDRMEALLNGTLEELIQKNQLNIQMIEKKVEEKKSNVLITKVSLSNLLFLKKVGEGQFGSVMVVKDKTTSRLYALKAISIAQVNDDGLEKHILVVYSLNPSQRGMFFKQSEDVTI